MLVFGQFFLLLILSVSLYYAVRLISDPRLFSEAFESAQALLANAASGLCALWLCAIFLDYLEKRKQ
jgi:hypothetical protein